jgi:hypothetical protein
MMIGKTSLLFVMMGMNVGTILLDSCQEQIQRFNFKPSNKLKNMTIVDFYKELSKILTDTRTSFLSRDAAEGKLESLLESLKNPT